MRILVIGTVRQAHDAIKNCGHEMVLFIKRKSSKPVDFSYEYEKMFVFDDDASDAEYIDVAVALNTYNSFDSVCAFNDDTQAIAIGVSEALGLNFPVSLGVLKTIQNKSVTRSVLSKAGLDDTKFYSVESEASLVNVVKKFQGKMIVKPADGTGSAGVSVLDSDDLVDGAVSWLKQCDEGYPVIVETFLEGEEYSVEALSENGEHFIFGITKKFKDSNNFVELGHVFPALLSESDERAVELYVSQCLSALGVDDGPSHTEVILTKHGPRIVETHSRVGGDRIFQLIELSTGINIFEMVVRQSLGEKVLPIVRDSFDIKKYSAIRFLALGLDDCTKISELNICDSRKNIEGLVEVTGMKERGDCFGVVTNSFGRTALSVATGETFEMSKITAEKGLELVELVLKRKEIS